MTTRLRALRGISLRALALAAFVAATAVPAAAQSTAPPATADGPPPQDAAPDADKSFADKAQDWAKRTQILERIQGDVDGWYPRLGGMTRGSGFNVGPGYRTHLFGDRVLADVSAGISIRNYKAVDARVRWLQAWSQRLEIWTDYRGIDFPQEDFYGLGPEAALEARTSYLYRANDYQVRALARPRPWLEIGSNVGLLYPGIGTGTDSRFPSTEELFTDDTAPGLATQPDYLHAGVFADIDYRDEKGNPTSGGQYHVALASFDDRTNSGYDFQRFDMNLLQHAPISPDRKHVVMGRLGTSFVNNAPDNRVPFYFLPYVGGLDTVRSYREFRFKEENALWLTAEYRYIPIKWVSLAGFADWGGVAHDWQDVTADMKTGYGVGFRIHTRTQTFARFDFGFGGGEGMRVFMRLGPSF